ncbi:MAG: hypothetical protein J2P15_19540 [Micromonosporaceae bacterium]|nr:hypothetical protein [Micromonosporaceae bacterium]
MTESYPEPFSDPAAEGIPEYADDDSTAWDQVSSTREADGPRPFALPAERDGGPVAANDYGITAEEQRHREPLDSRLAREEPDVVPDSIAVDPQPRLGGEADDEASAGQVADDSATMIDVPVDDRRASPVSEYDRDEPGVPTGTRVGRLVAPDEGAHTRTETDEYAFDEGAAGGGASAEEMAMSEVPPDEVQ